MRRAAWAWGRPLILLGVLGALIVPAALGRSPVAHPTLSAAVRLPDAIAPGLVTVVAGGAARPIASRPVPGQRLSVTLTLRRSDPAGFARFLSAVEDPRSRSFRHYLSPRQQADRFGPSAHAYGALLHWLDSDGIHARPSADRLTITALASRRQIERAFHVQIADWAIGRTRIYGTLQDPEVPAGLAGSIAAVSGLSNLGAPTARPADKKLAFSLCLAAGAIALVTYYVAPDNIPPPYNQYTPAGQGYTGINGELPPGQPVQYFGAIVNDCYNILTRNSKRRLAMSLASAGRYIGFAARSSTAHAGLRPRTATSAAPDGAGQKIGLLEYANYATTDVSDYLSLIGASASEIDQLSKTDVDGGAGPLGGPGESEALLDVDVALTIAPGADVAVYDAPDDTSFESMFNEMMLDHDTVISNSWSSCEDEVSKSEAEAIDEVLASAEASGISVLNAAGDSGSTCLDGSADTVGVPADSPHATAVGGTSLTPGPLGVATAESWWNGTQADPPTGQGGFGTSSYFTRPSYQAGLTSSTMRSVPDLSLNADPETGWAICEADDGGCPDGYGYGGTSAAAPLAAGLVAVMNQSFGHNVGDVNTTLYPLAGTQAFNSPQSMGSDFAHVGLGSPNLHQMILELDGTHAGPASPAGSGLVTDNGGVTPADGTSVDTLEAFVGDRAGNPLGGKHVTLAASSGTHSVIAPATGVADAVHGAVTFTASDTTPEIVTYTATDTDDNVVLGSATVDFVPPAATGASITGGPSTVSNDGSSEAAIYVYLENALGRPAAGKTVSISEGGGHAVITPAGSTTPGTTAVTDGAGTATFAATDTSAEAVDFTATDVTDGSLSVPGGLVVTFGPGTGTCNSAVSTPVAGFSASAFVTGLAFSTEAAVLPGNFTEPACSGQSPPAFDSSGNAYVANPVEGTINVLGPAGGVAGAANALPDATFNGDGLGSLVFGKDGSLYASLSTPGEDVSTPEIVQVDPATGAVIRVVADSAGGLPDCPFALVVDPLSGDLFTDDDCSGYAASSQITRIEDPAGVSPTVVDYANDNGALGLAFAPDGTLYVDNVSACTVDEIGATNTTSPTPTPVASVPCTAQGPFGLTVASASSSGQATALDVFSYGGDVSRIDLTQTPAVVSTVGSGSSYFYVGATTANGCDFAPLPGAIEEFGLGSGCGSPAAPTGPAIGLSSSGPSPAPTGSAVTFTAKLSNFASAAGTPVRFVVSGANAQQKLVQADSSGQASFTLTGVLTGGDSLQAVATNGAVAVESAPLTQRWIAGKDVSSLSMNTGQEGGPLGKSATLDVQLVDVSQTPPTPIVGASVQISLEGQSCTATTSSSGAGSCAVTPTGPAGLATVSASYAGTSTYTASSASNVFEAGGLGQQAVAPQVTTAPKITGTAKAGKTLSCSEGSWSNDPTSFAYQWSRDGTAIQGARSASYTVQSTDEGLTLTCTVTASNGAGPGPPSTSNGVLVLVPKVRGCPAATGRLSGTTLGLVKLGMTRTQARRAYTHSSNHGKQYEDFFCLTPIGVRVGYASPALLKSLSRSERNKLNGRVVWASTSSAYYTLNGVRVGATIATAGKRLKLGTRFQIGLNYWYLPPSGKSTGVLKVRHGIVQEIGITYKQLTGSDKADREFLTSFY
ncbi:MAG: protease pro-enzyme activation domain-containing protein [Solirubrobacteraceae bacterium]